MHLLPCRVFTFSDDEEEEKRVVRSQKDKRCGGHTTLSDNTCCGLLCLFCVCKDTMNSRLLSMP